MLEEADVYRARLIAMSEAGQPVDGENGFPLIVEAAERARATRDAAFEAWEASGAEWDDEPFHALEQVRFGPLPFEHAAAGVALLEAYADAGVFELIDRAGACPRCVPDVPEEPWEVEESVAESANVFHLSLIIPSAMRLAHASGDGDGIARFFERSLVLGRSAGWQFGSLARIQATGFGVMAMREAREELMEGGYDDRTCRRLLEAIDAYLPLPPVERCVNAIPVTTRWMAASDRRRFKEFAETSLRSLESIDALCAAAIEEASLPVRDRAREGHGFLERVIVSAAGAGTMEEIEAAGKRFPLLEHVAGSVTLMLDNDAWLVAETGATRIMLNLERHYRAHGFYPESLGDLVPEFMDAIPLDPACGGAFVYRLVDRDEFGRAYRLYSTGPDGTDDGGQMDESGTLPAGYAATPAGYDYEFTLPRRARD